MLKGNVKILLAIKIGGVAADPALQPVILAIVAGQAGKGVIILRANAGHASGHHRVFIAFQGLLWLLALRLETRGITQHQRAFHRRRLAFRLRHDVVKYLLRARGIVKSGAGQRYPALHVDRFRIRILQLRDLRAGGVFIALGEIDFRQAKARIAIISLLAQHPMVLGYRLCAIAALLRPIRQRQIVADRFRLLFNQGNGLRFLPAIAKLVGLAHHFVALQTPFQFTNIIGPLSARQRVNLRQRPIILIITGQIEAVGVNPFGIARLAVGHVTHQRVRFRPLAGADQIFRQPIGYPHAFRIQSQTPPLHLRGLRPAALAFQRFGLFFQPIVGKTAFDIINTAPLAGGEAGNIGAGFFRRFTTINIRQTAYGEIIVAIHA